MKIEHIAIWTTNLEEMKDFYKKYFNVKVGEKYFNVENKFSSYFLSFDDGSRLELMTNPFVKEPKSKELLSGYVHIAISVGSREKVDSLTQQIQQDGFEVKSSPRQTGDGYYESCVLDVEGNQVEITV